MSVFRFNDKIIKSSEYPWGYVFFRAIQATGGDTVEDKEIDGVLYRIHTFTTVGSSSFDVSDAGDDSKVDVLVVAGGGGGGSNRGSGGGAGGLIYKSGISVNEQQYTINVGDGGSGGTSNAYTGDPGEDSSAFNETAIGGGAGARPGDIYGGSEEIDGGSGGGGALDDQDYGYGTSGQGHDGGIPSSSNDAGAGGGGANTVGQDASTTAGDGGEGLYFGDKFSDSYGESGYFAGGGGGGIGDTSGEGLGGIGGGGDGGNDSEDTREAGVASTGGGGGGGAVDSSYRDGQPGGSGIVLIRYPLQKVA